MGNPTSNKPQPAPAAPPPIQIELPQSLEAVYSNFVVIQHTPAEFILDFARILPNMPTAKVGARVLSTPMHAKLLLRALQDNIERYEAQFGPIYVPQGDGLTSQLFGGGTPRA